MKVSLAFIGFPDYKIDKDGNVFSMFSNKNMKHSISPKHHDKYAKVMLSRNGKRKFVTVHRLLALAFLARTPERKYVNHIDGDITNNSLNNLEWVTALENNIHSLDYVRTPQFTNGFDIELPPRGDYKERGRGRSFINEDEVVKYCDYMMQGYRGCDLRIMMGISPKFFTTLKKHREFPFKHIGDRYDFSHLPEQKLMTPEQIHSICQMLQDGHTIMHTYKTLDIARSVVRGVASRKSHKQISKDYVW